MDLRDSNYTQVKDVIGTMRVLAKLPPQPELVHAEITRWLEQAAVVLEVFILPTLNQAPPLLDLRTGKQGSSTKTAELVGIAGKVEESSTETPGFLTPHTGTLKND